MNSQRAIRSPHARRVVDVGLGYVSLGQPTTHTLSGGERQRLKLAIHMAGSTDVYVLDEPTTGLHMADVDHLIGLLVRADWVIDLGPGAGQDGGRIVFEGPPAKLVEADNSRTGRYLRARIAASVFP